MAVAFVALIAALAGTAVAARHTTHGLTSAKVKKIARREAKLQIKKLAPKLTVAEATHAGTAGHADSADNAANAANASNAAALGGTPAGAYAIAASEPAHLVGAAGEPAFQNSWGNYGHGYSQAGFFKDSLGMVHLQGTMYNSTADNTIAFRLPAGYRPSSALQVPANADPEGGDLLIYNNGDVRPNCVGNTCDPAIGFDGLSFRAAG